MRPRTTLICGAIAVAVLAASCTSGVSDSPESGEPFSSSESTGYVVIFEHEADLAHATSISDWDERGEWVMKTLQSTADTSQADARETLKREGIEFESLWISNAMVLTGGKELGDRLAQLPNVSQVVSAEDVSFEGVDKSSDFAEVGTLTDGPTPSVDTVGAPQLWAEGATGKGILVGVIDTGTQYDHPALIDSYSGNESGHIDHDHSWWDPTGECHEPCDPNGHGTHVTGLAVGGDGPTGALPDIGVAPEASWIAARGCADGDCPLGVLLSSMQFMLAPTDLKGDDPDPSRRPHIVNNSWERKQADPAMTRAVDALAATGILQVFAVGDEGPDCATAGEPASAKGIFSVGAVNNEGEVDNRSSRGPGDDGSLAPDIVAAGVQVASSFPSSTYAKGSGTSMAAPAAAGALALLLQLDPSLVGSSDATQALSSSASAVSNSDCPGSGDTPSNNVYGSGIINLPAAADAVERPAEPS